MILTLFLSTRGDVDAKPARKAKGINPDTATASSDSQTLFENEPSPGPSVMRDPEILNRSEMLSLVKKYAVAIGDAVLSGERLRERAVRDKDLIKLACIQDRLSNMKKMKTLADSHLTATEFPKIRSVDLHLRHEFRGVELSHQRVLELHRELEACVGESLIVTVEKVGPEDSRDPTGTPIEVPKIERPVPASQYR